MTTNTIISTLIALYMSMGISAQKHSIEVHIDGLKSDKGKLMMQLMIENEKGELESVKDLELEIKSGVCNYSIKNIESGVYGIRYFHDEDDSGDLNTNWIGIPTEDYGFSNNATGTFGPPDFEDWKFSLKSDIKLDMRPV